MDCSHDGISCFLKSSELHIAYEGHWTSRVSTRYDLCLSGRCHQFDYQPCDWYCFVARVRRTRNGRACRRKRNWLVHDAMDWITRLDVASCRQVLHLLSHCISLPGRHSAFFLGLSTWTFDQQRRGNILLHLVWNFHCHFGGFHGDVMELFKSVDACRPYGKYF